MDYNSIGAEKNRILSLQYYFFLLHSASKMSITYRTINILISCLSRHQLLIHEQHLYMGHILLSNVRKNSFDEMFKECISLFGIDCIGHPLEIFSLLGYIWECKG